MAKLNAVAAQEAAPETETAGETAGETKMEQVKQWVAQAALLEAVMNDDKASLDATAKDLDKAKVNAVNLVTMAMIEGELTQATASQLYGEAFGFKTKKDGTKSETPDGTGETLRKRSTLLSQAYAIAQGNVPESLWPTSLAGKSITEINETMADWAQGSLSPWQAYKNLTQKAKNKLALFEDEKKLLEIVKSLQDQVTLSAVREDAALCKVYDAIAAAWLADTE